VRNRYSLKLRTAYRAVSATVRPSAWKRLVVRRVRLARTNALRVQGVLGATGLDPAAPSAAASRAQGATVSWVLPPNGSGDR